MQLNLDVAPGPIFPHNSLVSILYYMSSSFRVITDLEQVPAKLKRHIEPFYSVDPQSNKDKLNTVQRAFVKARAQDLSDSGSPLNSSYVLQLIKEGVDEHLWLSDFTPSTDLDFPQYLMNRLKNEKKKRSRRKRLLQIPRNACKGT